MKGLAQTLLAVTPLAFIILYFSLSQQKQIQIEQKSFEAVQEVEEAKFNKEFAEMSAEIRGLPLSEEKKAILEEEIKKKKKKLDKWETEFDKQFKESDKALEILREEIESKGSDKINE